MGTQRFDAPPPQRDSRPILSRDLEGAVIADPYFRSIADFNSTPGANRGTRFAAISMALPLRGFRTLRALRWETPNVPKPEIVTRSPLTSPTFAHLRG
ncbi:hypothetical protein SBA6_80056 [Candidatus Sulfopaludibacter sp. SbA6]|nr:hypothetical protein SBA6_80056 [Candidatus Sulfopaludibacter sp. SbA6]